MSIGWQRTAESFVHDGATYTGQNVGGWMMWIAPDADGKAANGTTTVMPAVGRFWPDDVREVYALRVVANLTQRCPTCGSDDLVGNPVAPRQMVGSLKHEPDCRLMADAPRLEAHVRGTATIRRRKGGRPHA